MPVERCICFNIPFAELRKYSQEHQCGLEELRKQFGCGRGCGLCIPYINAMLATGQTSFPHDLPPPGSSEL